MIFRLKAEATEPDADSIRSIWKQLRSKPFRSHEKRGAGLRQGAESWMARRRVRMTVSRSRAFPGCGAVSKSN